ncbi:MAG: sporulation transcriptional regulator SpoIIID [Candidatus Colwellbacteria bacterium]|nr:sporulation transcriptional regulator SpoIIID [Candidatus Colwellbacteria bacterium]MCK9497545.1 sporulation transcriptional regulator SpoIIID [Candidatus Colwellbacteria bacterium]MDD3752739.1 sporulation transcriptional regulator SpoIIID [Candidatus Colwellbacteria bacterium]
MQDVIYKLTEDEMFERIFEHACLVIDEGMTVREIAEKTHWSKTTVDMDVTIRLEKLDAGIAKEVRKVLDCHFEQKHMKGAQATREKYNKKQRRAG